jgi:hypothetical protein
MTKLRKGLRVSIPAMPGIPMGTVTEVTETTTGTSTDRGEGTVIYGAYVALDDGRTVHRWETEISVARQVLSPKASLLHRAMRYGARRVPGEARVYQGNGIRLEFPHR